ncbi:MAG: hypothetical protein HY698_20965 [Deltaproteobacteria bacterium]|nr:hypothetical protein [Deltaproteobacteria bacterium]
MLGESSTEDTGRAPPDQPVEIIAYAVVLHAVRSGTPVSYAGAVREVSVVIGAAVGVVWLKERSTSMRLVDSVLVGAGVVLIKVAG